MEANNEICANRFKLAKLLYKKKYYAMSQKECERLFTLQPNNVDIILLLSASFYMQGKYDQAIESLHKVPAKYRDCAEVINNIAANHFKKNDYQEACKEYHSAVSKDPRFVECWLSYIVTLIEMDNYDNAIQALCMVINYDSDLVEPYILYGQLFMKLNQFEEASIQFKSAIRKEPESYVAWESLGDSYAFNGKFHSAITCYQKALDINKQLSKSLINLGFMYYQIKKFDKSISILNKAVEIYPQHKLDILPSLGYAYYNNNNILAASKTFLLYLKDRYNTPVILHTTGLIYLNHFHRPAVAETFFKSCVYLDNKNVIYQKSLLNTYRHLNKKDLAVSMALKFAEIHIYKNEYNDALSILQNTASNLSNDNYLCHRILRNIVQKCEQLINRMNN